MLIVSAVALAASVWFGSGIWPRGYDFFATLPNRAFFSQLFKKEQPYISPMENLAKPRLLVVTNGGDRAVYYNSDASYAPYYEAVNTFFKATLSREDKVMMSTAVDEEEWYAVLRNDEILDTKSIYISYGTVFSPHLFAQVIGTEHTWLEKHATALSEFIVAPIGDTGEDVLLYVRDQSGGEVTKFYIHYPEKAALYSVISGMTEDLGYSYAFELNLHDSHIGIGGGVEQKVVMDPLILISPRSTESVPVEGTNPVENATDTAALLSVFGYRASGVNRHTGTDGTEYFVENYSSIHISPSGFLEYVAVDADKGVNILPAASGTETVYDALNGAVGFAARVWESLVPDRPFDALVSSDLVESETGEYVFTLDYYYEGTPIIVREGEMRHAVEIYVKDGKITTYRHILRRFAPRGEKVENIPMLEAIDGLYTRLSKEDTQIRIQDLYIAYMETEADTALRPVWCAKVEGKEKLLYYFG